MRSVSWEEAASISEEYALIFEREPSAKEYPIIEDDHGTLRFESDPVIDMLWLARKDNVMRDGEKALDLNALYIYGPGKNHPLMREFYRRLGYSLFRYWEIFHWEVNNELAAEYEE